MKKHFFNKMCNLALLSGAAIAGIHLADGIKNSSTVSYNHVRLKSNKITDQLDGYKIAFLTDIHGYPARKLKKVVAKLNTMNLDLLLLGGDFAHGYRAIYSLRALSKVKTTNGIFGVEGNHDNSDFLFPLMKSYGITPLLNQGVQLKKELYLGGVADFQNQKPDVAAALKDTNEKNFNILVCHNPDTTNMQNTTLADLTLSGHVHGGEVTFLGVWAPALTLLPRASCVTEYGQQFMAGHAKSNFGANVFVNRGLGNHFPIRIFCPREVTVISLSKK